MPKDNFTLGAAVTQARIVTEFWKRRGYHVNTVIVPLEAAPELSGKKRATGYTLETDMINGYPKELALKRTVGHVKGARRG